MFEEEVSEGTHKTTKYFLAFQASSTSSFLVGAEFVTLHPTEQVFDALMTWELFGEFAISGSSRPKNHNNLVQFHDGMEGIPIGDGLEDSPLSPRRSLLLY